VMKSSGYAELAVKEDKVRFDDTNLKNYG